MSFSTAHTGSLGRDICCKIKKPVSTVLLFPLQVNPQRDSGNGGIVSAPGDLPPHSDFSPLSIPHLSTGSGDCALGCWTCVLGDSQSAVLLFPQPQTCPLTTPSWLDDSLPCACETVIISYPLKALGLLFTFNLYLGTQRRVSWLCSHPYDRKKKTHRVCSFPRL